MSGKGPKAKATPAPPTKLESLLEGEISKTGYVVENTVASALKEDSWNVITGKYYVDDNSEGTVREIDMLAYRVSKFEEVDVYTVLVISCKKSADNVWALLSRPANLQDPNTDYWPIHAWSNDPALNYQLTLRGKGKEYHSKAGGGRLNALAEPDVEVFAFQEMKKTTGTVQNDTAIFNAITTLVKAQAYELSVLPSRKKTPSVYQFNLLSVAGTEMYRLMFASGKIVASPLYSQQYLARYIVRKRESFSRIRFVTGDVFSTILDDYKRLHVANGQWFAEEHQAFYKDVMQDEERVECLAAVFKKKIHYPVMWRLQTKFKSIDPGDPTISWKAPNVVLGYAIEEAMIEWLNGDEGAKRHVGNALASVYRYTGPFLFEWDIPF